MNSSITIKEIEASPNGFTAQLYQIVKRTHYFSFIEILSDQKKKEKSCLDLHHSPLKKKSK